MCGLCVVRVVWYVCVLSFVCIMLVFVSSVVCGLIWVVSFVRSVCGLHVLCVVCVV